jgi:hypothetical protein
MAPLRTTSRVRVRNGALILTISLLVLAQFQGPASGQGLARPPTRVSHPPKIDVTVFAGVKKTDAVIASPVIVQYDGSRLVSKTFKTRDSSILEVSSRDTSLRISVPALPQFVQIESAHGLSTNSTPIGKTVIDRCGPSAALDLLSHCAHGHESNGRWEWNVRITAARYHFPYLIVYVRWVTDRKNGPSVIYLGLWEVPVQRHARNTAAYGG